METKKPTPIVENKTKNCKKEYNSKGRQAPPPPLYSKTQTKIKMETKETIRQSHEENQYGKMIVFDFGKNGLGITDELIAIGKNIQELSEENLVHLSSESFIDDADDVYTLKFYVTPKETRTE